MVKNAMLRSIFVTFLRIGPVTFGGGFAAIPVMEREIAERRKWMASGELADVFAVAQSVPGAVAINAAALIGYRLAGIRGALAAALGVLLPAFGIIVLLSFVFLQIKDNPKIAAALISIRATIAALIVYAAVKFGKTAIIDKTSAALIVLTVALLYFGGTLIHPVWIIIGGALAGMGIVELKRKLGRKLPAKKETQVFDYMI